MLKDSSGFKKIAHRGASGEAPENTLPAFQLAFQKYRCDQVEMDIRLTKDHVPVVIHDATVDRTTNGKGPLNQYTLKEIQSLDAGFYFDPDGRKEFPYRGKNVRVSTLEEILTEFPDSGFCLEVKDRTGPAPEKTIEVLSRVPHPSRLIIGSFSGRVARDLRKCCNQAYETFLTEDEIIRLFFLFRSGFQKVSVPALHASLPRAKYGIRLDGTGWIEFLHRQGVKVYYWTVNDPREMKELIRKGADGILTDYPDRLIEASNSKQ